MPAMENPGRAMRVLIVAGALLLLTGSPAFHVPADPGKSAAYDHSAATDAIVVHITGSRQAYKPGAAQLLFRRAIKSVILLPRVRESLAYPVHNEIVNPHYDKFLPWSSSSYT